MRTNARDYYNRPRYIGGQGLWRMMFAVMFISAALFEPSYEMVHRSMALGFGLLFGFYGVRAAIEYDRVSKELANEES